MDSCNARKLDPGLDAMYSRPRDLMTSSMKSAPGRSVVRTSMPDGSLSSGKIIAVAVWRGAGGGVLPMTRVPPTSVAMPPAAALFRNLRRLGDIFFLDMAPSFEKSRSFVKTQRPETYTTD